MIYFGTRLFGMVHLVPGRFYVSTKFFHLFFIPLLPLGSWVVVKETDGGWEGRPIGISLLSVVVAWIRAALVLAYLGICVKMFVDIFTQRLPMDASRALMFAGISVLCIVAFRLTYRLSVASTKKAQQLALALGYSEADAARVEVPPGSRALGRPGWGLAIALIPLLAWGVTGLVMGKFLWADPQSRPLEALRNMKGNDAISVARVLDEMGPVTPAGVDVYRKYMSDPAHEVRFGAAMALGRIGDAGKAGIPELINGLKDENLQVRQRCASTLIQFGGGYEAGVDNLIQMLDDPADRINTVLTRDLAAQALGKLGPAAESAIPMLEKAQKSQYSNVSRSAEAALKVIRPEGEKRK